MINESRPCRDKCHTADEHDEENAAAGKHIDRFAIVRLTLLQREQLGRHVRVGAAASGAHRAVDSDRGRQTEIGELDIELIIQQKVLGFHVTVHNVGRVARVEARNELVKVGARQLLVERAGHGCTVTHTHTQINEQHNAKQIQSVEQHGKDKRKETEMNLAYQ